MFPWKTNKVIPFSIQFLSTNHRLNDNSRALFLISSAFLFLFCSIIDCFLFLPLFGAWILRWRNVTSLFPIKSGSVCKISTAYLRIRFRCAEVLSDLSASMDHVGFGFAIELKKPSRCIFSDICSTIGLSMVISNIWAQTFLSKNKWGLSSWRKTEPF